MNVKLVPYNNEKEEAINLIISFWQVHNCITPCYKDALDDLNNWTKEGHLLYFICLDELKIGFIHLGSRGCEIDWLEDIFVLVDYQNKGIGSEAIRLVEDIVKTYSDSLYIEAAARNIKAIRLYRKIGYDCLNTITIRKDFSKDKYEKISEERVFDLNFEVRK